MAQLWGVKIVLSGIRCECNCITIILSLHVWKLNSKCRIYELRNCQQVGKSMLKEHWTVQLCSIWKARVISETLKCTMQFRNVPSWNSLVWMGQDKMDIRCKQPIYQIIGGPAKQTHVLNMLIFNSWRRIVPKLSMRTYQGAKMIDGIEEKSQLW